MALGPSSTRPRTTMPAPTPVPRIDTEHDRRALPRAVARLRQREAVRVVRDPHLASERCLEIAPDRPAVEAHRIRAAQAGRSRARSSPACRRRRSRRRRARARRRGRVAPSRRALRDSRRAASGSAAAGARAPVRVERDDFDLGAAEIDAQRRMRPFLRSPWAKIADFASSGNRVRALRELRVGRRGACSTRRLMIR